MSTTKMLAIGAVTAAGFIAPAPAFAGPTFGGQAAAPSLSSSSIRHLSVAQLRRQTPRFRTAVAEARVDRSHGYQAQRSCRGGARPGARALANLLHRTYDRRIPVGIHRACGGGTSEHYEGRALDWMTNARNRRQAAQADAFVTWLTKRDRHDVRGAWARRLGVMYIIWRGKMWRTYDPGWRNYNGCANGGDPTACHFDHVHISLTWQGAYKKTSWYRVR